MNKKINCAILSIYPFPIGMAATNRILAYSKGLVENNVDVDIFIPIPTDRPTKHYKYGSSGVFEGVSYYYTLGRFSNRFRAVRALSILSGYRKFYGFISTCNMIYKNSKIRKYNCLIISTDRILPLLIYSIFTKTIKVKSIFIFDEYPTPIRHKLKDKIPLWKTLAYQQVLKNITAYISISEELKRYFNSICPKQTLILPIITDTSRFKVKSESTSKEKKDYICYMGNMELTKDNIDIIIKAFALIANKYPNIELHLYGELKKQTQKTLAELIINQNLENRAFMKGRISSEMVSEVLMNAKILVSSQPNTLRASGGFPTKLGEYLASGTPALLTDVGENSKYVKQGVHVFFSKPHNVKMYAEKLDYILANYNEAEKVASNGKKFLEENYSHKAMGKRLKNFIVKINN